MVLGTQHLITFALFFLEIRWLSDVQSVRTSTIQGATNNYVKFEHYKRGFKRGTSSEVGSDAPDGTYVQRGGCRKS